VQRISGNFAASLVTIVHHHPTRWNDEQGLPVICLQTPEIGQRLPKGQQYCTIVFVGNWDSKMQGDKPGWSIERIILTLLSLLVGLVVFSALISSWSEPQIEGRLSRYQTDMLLRASSLGSGELSSTLPPALADSLLGKEALATAKTQYQEARIAARDKADDIQRQVKESPKIAANGEVVKGLKEKLKAAQQNLQEINLELGIIQAVQQQPAAAQQLWQQIGRDLPESAIATTADTLDRLWTGSSVTVEAADRLFHQNLRGWFQYEGLKKLYANAPAQLQALANTEEAGAWSALYRLAAITILRGGTLLLGVGLSLVAILRQLWQLRRPAPTSGALVKINSALGRPWSLDYPDAVVPWNLMVVWKVLLGFFLIGQLILPQALALIVAITGFQIAAAPLWQKSLYVLISYGLMAIAVTTVLGIFIAPFQPLAAKWFNWLGSKSWVAWGLGGYLIATPIVLIVSVINERIWQGKGGSNPILSVVLESKDSLSFLLLAVTASVAAPLFEEYLFRGFLLNSLTKYLSAWQSILISGLIFAVAHLSVSEVLPLATLGVILGYVHYRTGSLLAPMLLHGLWNGGSMVTLYLLAG
jgi:uncharacterized protein